MGEGYDFQAPDSVHRLSRDGFPAFEPNFNTVAIGPGSRLTDLLSTAPLPHVGYLVSERLRALLERFTLPAHRFYPVPVHHRHRTVDGYFWMHLPEPPLSIPEEASVPEAEALINAHPELSRVDLLELYRPEKYAYCFISDALRQAMEREKITGVRIRSARLFRAAPGGA